MCSCFCSCAPWWLLVSDIFVSLALSGFLNSIICCISKLSCDVSFPWSLRSLTKVHSGLFCHFVLYAFMFLCFFQTVLFSSFSGILSLICFTNCPQALWCFTCVHLFLSPLSVYKKNSFLRKTSKEPKDQPYLSRHTSSFFFFFFPLNFYVMCFRFPAFLGGDVTLWIWSLYLILMDSCGFWAVTRERFYIKPSLWSWEILRRTLQLCSPKKNCISHAAFVCSANIQTAGLLSCFGSCIVIDLSAPLVAMAPWTRKTASGPRLCRTSRPAASQRFSGSWR